MLLDGHVISTGADGRLVGMTSGDVTALMSRALRSDRIVMHFHGGLVGEARGMQIAQDLLPVYTGAGAYPVFFIWQAGALEIVRNNLLEIAREELFDRLIRRVLSWAVGKVRGAQEGSRGGPIHRPSQQELDEQLGARKRLTDPDFGSEPFTDEHITPPAFEYELVGAEGEPLDLTPAEEQQFLIEVGNDAELQQQVAGVVAHRQMEWTGLEGARGVQGAEPVPSMIDEDVLAQIAEGTDEEGARGLVSTTVLVSRSGDPFTVASNRVDDLVGGLRPFEGFGVVVPELDPLFERAGQLVDRAEDATVEPAALQFSEPSLDLV
jgi:hypothetical protein